MGNSIAGSRKKRVKVMKANGETMKLRVPLRAGDVTKGHPGHVILDSEAVKHFGIRARPLEPHQSLDHKRIYFLVEMIPYFADHDRKMVSSRRVQSGISMSAKDRLECLMLSRRSASDMTFARAGNSGRESGIGPVDLGRPSSGPMSVKMRIPKSEMVKLIEESRDENEVADKIIGIYMRNRSSADDVAEGGNMSLRRDDTWSSGRSTVSENRKPRQKRVSFLPVENGEIRLA